jgi:hypothetical protein
MNFCKAVGEGSHMDEWASNIYAFMELHMICEQEPAGDVHELQSRLARPKKACMTKRWNQNVAHMMEQTGKKTPMYAQSSMEKDSHCK